MSPCPGPACSPLQALGRGMGPSSGDGANRPDQVWSLQGWSPDEGARNYSQGPVRCGTLCHARNGFTGSDWRRLERGLTEAVCSRWAGAMGMLPAGLEL